MPPRKEGRQMRTIKKIPTLNALANTILKKLTEHGTQANKKNVIKFLKSIKLKWCTGGYKRSFADIPFKGENHGIYWYEWRRDEYESYIRIYTINNYYKDNEFYQALVKVMTPPPQHLTEEAEAVKDYIFNYVSSSELLNQIVDMGLHHNASGSDDHLRNVLFNGLQETDLIYDFYVETIVKIKEFLKGHEKVKDDESPYSFVVGKFQNGDLGLRNYSPEMMKSHYKHKQTENLDHGAKFTPIITLKEARTKY